MIKDLLENLKVNILKIVNEMGASDVEVVFEVPKDEAHGDYSTNIAMRLAKVLRKPPMVIANDIISKIDLKENHLDNIEVAGAGFINLYIDKSYLANVVFKILKEKENYGSSNVGEGKKVLLEFVSANPTGYLHIGHGRGASYGDSLARMMKKAGYNVTKEHYVNDGGNQINNLIRSIYERYRELFGLSCNLDDDCYHGKEIIEIAQMIKDEKGDYYLNNDYHQDFRHYGLDYLLNGLKKDLKDFRVEFDNWFSEKSLYDSNKVKETLDYLIKNNYTYEKEDALWLKTTIYGDDKDRVLVKSDGSYTYLLPDIAYHANKIDRGYDELIDVFGSDHHGYISRLKASISFFGKDPDILDVEILQMVRALSNGVELKMSKRSGKAITLRDLMDEVGTDALRYMYISKSLDTHMDLDLDLAVQKTNDNPVYYAQYAYARIASVFRVCQEKNIDVELVNSFKKLDISKVTKLINILIQYPEYVEMCATKKAPHKMTQYIQSLARALHSYYNDEKIISDDLDDLKEKLTLLKAVQLVLKDALELIGVGVMERM